VLVIETPTSTRQITGLLSDDEYAQFQSQLVADPKAGDVIPGSGGLRKIRWSRPGQGKRGGIRVIYFAAIEDRIYLLAAFAKSVRDDLTIAQIKVLRRLVGEE
jgi:hypothetical protein